MKSCRTPVVTGTWIWCLALNSDLLLTVSEERKVMVQIRDSRKFAIAKKPTIIETRKLITMNINMYKVFHWQYTSMSKFMTCVEELFFFRHMNFQPNGNSASPLTFHISAKAGPTYGLYTGSALYKRNLPNMFCIVQTLPNEQTYIGQWSVSMIAQQRIRL